MLNSLARTIANRFFDDKDKYPMEVYVYGIELIISSIISTALIILVGIVTNTFIECLMYMFSFSLIRIYTGGYHSMTYLRCITLSVLSYVLIFLSLKFFSDVISDIFVMLGGYVLTMVLAILFAPVKHENKELTNEEKKKYKLLSLLMITLFYPVCMLLYYVIGIKQTLVIFPTCIVIDIAMLVSVIKNYIILRRSSQ